MIRVEGTLYWIFSDHLQSSSVILEEDGDTDSRTTYTAFGEERYTVGTSPTDYTESKRSFDFKVKTGTVFTRTHGQRSYTDDFGLMYYVARWYDPVTAHFVQADTIIPQPGNSGDWNRYAYVLYNPANFSDPTGHSYSGDDEWDDWYNNQNTNTYYGPEDAQNAEELADYWGIDISQVRDILPQWIPSYDEKVFRAYIYLLKQTNEFVINPFTGEKSTGQEFALFLGNNEISIVDEVYHREFVGSTEIELHTCPGHTGCVYSSDPTVIHLNFSDMSELEIASKLAHEAYHLQHILSGVSQTEEVMAYYAQYNIYDPGNRLRHYPTEDNFSILRMDPIVPFKILEKIGVVSSYQHISAWPTH
jgi:RHS repeat-associated protein